MPSWKKVIVSGSDATLNSLAASSQITIGAVTASSENTLILGPPPAGGSGEGGQLILQSGPGYTSGSMLDNWQNMFRILRGSNSNSDALVAQWSLQTKQMQLPAYTSVSSFSGTAAANLAVDSGGNVITVSTTGGTVFPYTGNAVITGSLTTTGIIYAQPNGGMYFQGGDDAALYDINLSNHMGIYGVQDSTIASIKLGSGGGIISGKSGNIGIGTTNPTSASLQINGNVFAASFTGSLQGTASFATSASVATSAPLYLPLAGGTLTGNLSAAGRTFTFQDLVLGSGTTFGTIKTDGTKYIGMFPTNGTESTRFLANGNVMHGTTFTDAGYRLQVSASTAVSGALQVIGTAVFTGSVLINGSLNATSLTGSLQGTASYATTSLSASYALTAATASNGSSLFTIGSNKTFSEYNSSGTNDALKLRNSSAGATFGVQNANASGFSGIEYIDNANAVKVFTGYNNDGTGEFRFNNIASNGYITFKIGSTDKLTIANSGNVGIGKTSPNATLDVNGNSIITGSLTVTGRITAEEFHTEFVSSSIVFQSGSTKFGNSSDDVMSVTGSLRVNGSITGSLFGTASFASTASYVNPLTQNVIVTGNLNVVGTSAIGSTSSLSSYTISDGVSSLIDYDQIDAWTAYNVTGEILWNEPINDTITRGQLVARTASGWILADNKTSVGISSYMLGIALKDATASSKAPILLKGIVTSAYNGDQTSAAAGSPVYMDTAGNYGAGYMLSTAPSMGGSTVRIVGYTYINSSNQSAGQYVLRFDPSSTWVEL